MRPSSSAETGPESRQTLAVRTAGRSAMETSWMHSAQESARWSNCPGRYSMAKTASASGRLSRTASTWGSEKTTGRQRRMSVSSMPSMS